MSGMNFISNVKEETPFMITSGAFGQTAVPVVHDMAQVSTIYIFCGNKSPSQTVGQTMAQSKGCVHRY